MPGVTFDELFATEEMSGSEAELYGSASSGFSAAANDDNGSGCMDQAPAGSMISRCVEREAFRKTVLPGSNFIAAFAASFEVG